MALASIINFSDEHFSPEKKVDVDSLEHIENTTLISRQFFQIRLAAEVS